MIGLNKTSLFFSKNIMKRSCCKLLTRRVTNTPNPDTYVSHLFRCLFICVVEKVCSFFFFSLLLSYSFRNYLGTPVFFIYIKRALFLLVQTCMICYPGGIQWSWYSVRIANITADHVSNVQDLSSLLQQVADWTVISSGAFG